MLLTARQAADRLGIKLDTLYAYVSRGRLPSVEMPGSRERRYREEDVALLRERRPREAPSEAMTPVIASAICLIEAGRFYYRGEDVVRLSQGATLEEAACLLWQVPGLGEWTEAAEEPSQPVAAGLVERAQMRLAALAGGDLLAVDLSRSGVIRTGTRILRDLAALAAGAAPSAAPAHLRLARAWRLDASGADILRRALVLIADHELNASTFVARCVASTGATPYAVVAAALAALSGRRHGGVSARAEALFHDLTQHEDPLAAMAARLARGEDLPGFGHLLYPEGDPRAKALLDAVAVVRPKAWPAIVAVAEAGTRLGGRPPNVDFALAAATAALGLPQGAALALFVVGRSVGWIAHALEQYESGILIRPRARYAGPRPVLEPARLERGGEEERA
ncbi:MAG TPA: citrate synthase family protein [Stellaceae bacterium]|nr:citrate synthase family protein [Stellaceae bacterium]